MIEQETTNPVHAAITYGVVFSDVERWSVLRTDDNPLVIAPDIKVAHYRKVVIECTVPGFVPN
jgi:hypothetical protein